MAEPAPSPRERTFAWAPLLPEYTASLRSAIFVSVACVSVSTVLLLLWANRSGTRDGRPRQFSPSAFLEMDCCVLGTSLLAGGMAILTAWSICVCVRRCRVVASREDLPEALSGVADLRWPLRRFVGDGGQTAIHGRAGTSIRALADRDVAMQLDAIELPEGLVEPASSQSGVPWTGARSLIRLLLTVPIFGLMAILMAAVALGFIGAAPASARFILGGLALMCAWGVLVTVLELPLLQRNLHDVPVLGVLARRSLLRAAVVVGPGFATWRGRTWRADHDLMLVRTRRFASPESTIEVMFAGGMGRLRRTYVGLSDPAFIAAWRAWNGAEIRPELAQSELARATG